MGTRTSRGIEMGYKASSSGDTGVARAAPSWLLLVTWPLPSGLSHHVQLQEGKEVSLWVTVAS